MNFKESKPNLVIKDNLDIRWVNKTIYNHYATPTAFMNDVLESGKDHSDSEVTKLIADGEYKYSKIDKLNIEYDTLYKDVAAKVKSKLIARGFTTQLLYADVNFTTENTGLLSKQRAMLGKRDCYYETPGMTDGKLFHDIYINLSYSASISDSTIKENAYALYALTKELSRLIPMRVFVINHVGTDIPTCYSYVLKRYGMPINPKEFLFFLSDSKRTFGWATYTILNDDNNNSTVGEPEGTVSIARFNLDTEIDTIFNKVNAQLCLS